MPDASTNIDQTKEAVRSIVADAPAYQPSAPAPKGDESDGEGCKRTQAAMLADLAADAGVDLWHTPDGECFADLQVDGHRETHRLDAGGFRDWLSHRFYQETGKPPGSQALQDALGVLRGRARFDGLERRVFVRIGDHDGAVYLDLGAPDWSAVEVTAGGWRIVAAPPIRFRRPRSMRPLPIPVAGGRTDELLPVLNIRQEDWPLIAGWLLAALYSKGPYPLLVLHGEQGSGKTSLARALKSLIDPSTAGLRAEPRTTEDLMIGATSGWVIAFDNLSHVPGWLSGALCRLSTGGGFAKRALYTNDEEVILDAQRPVILTGINELASRSDLLDRAILVDLPTISPESRRPESIVAESFEAMRGRVLGALLDALAIALRRKPSLKLDRLPRLADFALLVTAAEPGLGLKDCEFMAAYEANREGSHSVALESSPVASAVLALMDDRAIWRGSPSVLLQELAHLSDDGARRNFPKTAKALGDALRRYAPNLRAMGIEWSCSRSGQTRTYRLEKSPNPASFASPASQMASLRASGSDAEVTHRDPSDALGAKGDALGAKGDALENPASHLELSRHGISDAVTQMTQDFTPVLNGTGFTEDF